MFKSAATAPWASGERGSRANNFDFIRLMLAIGVIVSHGWLLIGWRIDKRPAGGEPLLRWTNGQFSFGTVCVSGFFVLSGYLIAASWVHSRGVGDYLMKRVRRILPGYLVAVAVSLGIAAVAGAGFRFGPGDVVRRAIFTLFMQYVRVDGAFPHNPMATLVNGSLWTIQHEFYCYLLIVLIGAWIVRGRGGVLIAAVVMLAVLAALVATTGWQSNPSRIALVTGRPAEWPRLAGHFLAGTAFFIYRKRIPHDAKLAVVAATSLIAAAFMPPALWIVSPIALAYLLLWLAYHPRIPLHHFGRYGDFSYGVYLYAFPIQQYLIYAGVTKTVATNIALSIPLSLIAGIVSWHVCEKRFMHYRVSGRRPDTLTEPTTSE